MVFTLFLESWQMAAATSCFIMVAFKFMNQIALEEESSVNEDLIKHVILMF